MVQATLAPKVKDARLLAVPYACAGALIALALTQLLGFGGFDFAGIKLETTGPAWAVIALATAEIFALPFLLRLKLSPLARACSAVLVLVAPLFYLASAIFIRDQTVSPVTMFELSAGAVVGVLAIASFNVLGGSGVFSLKKSKVTN